MPLVSSAAVFLGLLVTVNAQPATSVTLAGFQALLFNSKTGTFSKDVLTPGGPRLGNVQSGDTASVSTFIIVRAQVGKRTRALKNLRLRIVATESGSMPFADKGSTGRDRTILDQTADFGPAGADGVTYTGFWLSQTGCRTVTLKAWVVGAPEVKPLTSVLPFTCYE
jgi:hypothetical protein